MGRGQDYLSLRPGLLCADEEKPGSQKAYMLYKQTRTYTYTYTNACLKTRFTLAVERRSGRHHALCITASHPHPKKRFICAFFRLRIKRCPFPVFSSPRSKNVERAGEGTKPGIPVDLAPAGKDAAGDARGAGPGKRGKAGTKSALELVQQSTASMGK